MKKVWEIWFVGTRTKAWEAKEAGVEVKYVDIITEGIPKYRAHQVEKFSISLYFSKYGKMPDGMKVPYPRDLNSGKIIKP